MRNAGLSIETLSEYVELFSRGHETVQERRSLLIEQKEKLLKKQEDIKNTISRLDVKIKIYDDIVNGKRKDFMEEP